MDDEQSKSSVPPPPRFCSECKMEMLTIWHHESGCSVPQQIVDMMKKKQADKEEPPK